jgi:hypothetical protein
MSTYYVLWTPNERSDCAFDVNHPYFFAEKAFAEKFLAQVTKNGGNPFGDFSGPYYVPAGYNDAVGVTADDE